MTIERKIKKQNGQYMDEIFLVKDSSIAYLNGIKESYLFDPETGLRIENKELEKEVLKTIRQFLYQ